MDGDLHDALSLTAEQRERVWQFIEREVMGDQRSEVDSPVPDHVQKTPHTLLSAGAKRRHDFVVTEAGCECAQRDLEIARVDAET